MHFVAAILLLTSLPTAPEAQRPLCNAANRGRFWPEEANLSPKAARRFAQDGELQMCVQAAWKHKWQRLGVHVRDLRKSTASR